MIVVTPLYRQKVLKTTASFPPPLPYVKRNFFRRKNLPTYLFLVCKQYLTLKNNSVLDFNIARKSMQAIKTKEVVSL